MCRIELGRYIWGVVVSSNTFLIHSKVQNQLKNTGSREAEMKNLLITVRSRIGGHGIYKKP